MRRFEIVDKSMEPALHPGDYIVASRPGRVRLGAPIVFEHPNRPGFVLVKRAVAVAGDVVSTTGDRLRIEGSRDLEVGIAVQPASRITVPDGHVFALSDAALSTRADSRTFGPVPVAMCRRVLFRYWPVRR